MSYLDILGSRMLVMFSPPIAKSSPPMLEPPSPPGSPTSSTSSLLAISTPPPVAVSLLSIVYDDAHCAHFLANHVLASAAVHPETYDVHDAETRLMTAAAEVLVWQEISRAKSFARDLGLLFTRSECVCEEDLVELAASHGLGLAPGNKRVRASREHEEPNHFHADHVDATAGLLA